LYHFGHFALELAGNLAANIHPIESSLPTCLLSSISNSRHLPLAMAGHALIDLPSELIQTILAFLEPFDLACVAQTCRQLQVESYDNQIWLRLINRHLPDPTNSLGPMETFRGLYIAHHPHWFLPQHRVWFGDSEPSGKLLVTRYDEATASINAYTAVATVSRGMPVDWEIDSQVKIHMFAPKVSLDLNQPVVKLHVDSPNAERPPNDFPSDRSYAFESVYTRETLMDTFTDPGLYSSFLLCRDLPSQAISENTSVWPPLKYPAVGRTRNDSLSRFNSTGHKPTRLKELSKNTFRLRKWAEFTGRRTTPSLLSFGAGEGFRAAIGADMSFFASGNLHAGGGVRTRMPERMSEDITTYATLPESSFRPTPQKPWQGVWVGDYSGHGCEFLVIHQPDKQDQNPLPSGMNWLQRWLQGDRRSSNSSEGSEGSENSFVSAAEEREGSASTGESSIIETDDNISPHPPTGAIKTAHGSSGGTVAPSGRLEAIKITGDPNIPRAEYTFIAPEIGDAGLVRIADEEPFKGARVVKSAGHIANRGYREGMFFNSRIFSPGELQRLTRKPDKFTPCHLILISHNQIAQLWQQFGHISFFQRVDIDALAKYGEVQTGMGPSSSSSSSSDPSSSGP
jgi:hypothetical protein